MLGKHVALCMTFSHALLEKPSWKDDSFSQRFYSTNTTFNCKLTFQCTIIEIIPTLLELSWKKLNIFFLTVSWNLAGACASCPARLFAFARAQKLDRRQVVRANYGSFHRLRPLKWSAWLGRILSPLYSTSFVGQLRKKEAPGPR